MAAPTLPQNNRVAPPTGFSPGSALDTLQKQSGIPTLTAPAAAAPAAPAAPPVAPQAPIPVTPSVEGPHGGNGTAPDQSVIDLAKAIRTVESNNNFSATGKSGEYGAYQFEPSTWNATSSKFGVNVPLEQATPEQQNFVAASQIAEWKAQGYNVGQIASMWNAGPGAPNAYLTGNKGVNGSGASYDTEAYAKKVGDTYQSFKAQSTTPLDLSGGTDSGAAALPDYGATFPYAPSDNGLVAGFKALGNLPSSVYGFGAGLVNTVLHPIDTLKNLGQGAIGAVENATGENAGAPDANQQVANAIGKALIDRYGGVDKLANTATNDPFGFGTDVASILAGGAGVLGKGTELADLGSRAAQVVTAPIADLAASAGSKLADATLGGTKADVVAAAGRTGIELPAASYTSNPLIHAAEGFAATGAGEAAATARVDSALAKMDTLAARIVTSAGGTTDLTDAGTNIAKGLADFEKQNAKANELMFGTIRDTIGDVAAKAQTTASALDHIISSKEAIADTEGIKYFKDKLDVLNGAEGHKPPTLETLKKMRTSIGEKIGSQFTDPFVKTNVVQLKQMYSSLTRDIRQTIVATRNKPMLALYDKANKAYQAGYQVISSQYARTIRRLAENGQHSKIVDSLIRPSMAAEDIPRILQVAGTQGAKDIRAGFLNKIVEGAKNADGDFTAMGINKMMKKFGPDKVEALATPEQIQGLKDIGTLTEAIQGSVKIAEGAQPGYFVRQALQFRSLGEVGGVGYALYDLASGNVLGAVQKLAAVIGVEAASGFLASEAGQRILKLGATRGSEFVAEAKKAGLTSPPESANVAANDTGNSSGGASGGGNSGSSDTSNSPILGNAVAQGNPASKITATAGSPEVSGGAAAPTGVSIEDLAKAKRFDLKGARAAGFTDAAIVAHLLGDVQPAAQ